MRRRTAVYSGSRAAQPRQAAKPVPAARVAKAAAGPPRFAWRKALVPSLLGNQGFGILPADIPLDPFRLLSIAFFAIVPFVVTRIVEGPGSARRLFRQVRHVRVGPQWYVIALFGPPAVLFVAAVITFLFAVLRQPGRSVKSNVRFCHPPLIALLFEAR